LKRKKAIRDINDSLLKKSEVTFMFLTFSYLAVAFAKYTFDTSLSFNLEDALKAAIALAEQNRVRSIIEQTPVIIFTTLIDAVTCEYRIFSYMVPYPVKYINSGYEVDSDKLTITF
jgi:hypothetical protein